MLSLLGKDLSKEKYEILINAKRCLAFELGNEDGTITNEKTSKVWYESQNASNGPNNRIVTKTRTQTQINSIDDTSKKEVLGPRISDSKVVEDNKGVNSLFPNNSSVDNKPASQFVQSYTPSSYGLDNDVKNETVEKKADTVQVTNPTNEASNNSNMTELMRRLKAAEDKVDKMKAASDEAENESIRQKKLEDENALIKELRGQIAELKDTKTKKDLQKDVVTVNPIVEQPRPQTNNFVSSNSSGSLFSNGMVNAPPRQEAAPKATESYDA